MLQGLTHSWKAFSASCWLWKCFPCKKVAEMFEVVAVSWWEVKWIWRMRQNFVTQFIQLLKRWLCYVVSDIAVENWALSVDQCWLQALQFLVYLIDLLSVLLRCTGFARIQKAIVGQTGSRPPNSDHDIFWYKFSFGKCFGVSSWPSHWVGHHQLSYKIHFSSHVTIQSNREMVCCCKRRWHFKLMIFFWFVISSQGTHLLSFFTFPICFKCWMTIEWLTLNSWATSCIAVKRVSFDNGSQLVIVSFQCLATVLFTSLVFFAKLPKPALQCIFISSLGSNTLLMFWVTSAALWPILNLNKKITQIFFLFNMICLT